MATTQTKASAEGCVPRENSESEDEAAERVERNGSPFNVSMFNFPFWFNVLVVPFTLTALVA